MTCRGVTLHLHDLVLVARAASRRSRRATCRSRSGSTARAKGSAPSRKARRILCCSFFLSCSSLLPCFIASLLACWLACFACLLACLLASLLPSFLPSFLSPSFWCSHAILRPTEGAVASPPRASYATTTTARQVDEGAHLPPQLGGPPLVLRPPPPPVVRRLVSLRTPPAARASPCSLRVSRLVMEQQCATSLVMEMQASRRRACTTSRARSAWARRAPRPVTHTHMCCFHMPAQSWGVAAATGAGVTDPAAPGYVHAEQPVSEPLCHLLPCRPTSSPWACCRPTTTSPPRSSIWPRRTSSTSTATTRTCVSAALSTDRRPML